MPPLARSIKLLQKAEAALVAAIEAYNRPTFAYREETFAILALNAWELLVKAKLLAESGNDPRRLNVYETRPTRHGHASTKRYLKRNRSGNALTLSLFRVITELENNTQTRVPQPVRTNLEALVEIRDNAVHFIAASPQLGKHVLEVGTASVKNFIELARNWFAHDFTNQHFFLMPIGFLNIGGRATAIPLSGDEARLIAYLANLTTAQGRDTDYHVTLQVDLSFKRAATTTTTAVVVSNDPNAPGVMLIEEDIRKIYKWDYKQLTQQLSRRYIDFKQDQKFHAIRKPLQSEPRYVRTRYLDPANPGSTKKDYYAPAILTEFDKHYTRHAST